MKPWIESLKWAGILTFCLVAMQVFISYVVLSHSKANAAGRDGELRRYENEEVVCYSRHDRDSSIFCKWK
jgi:hypothetical protein